jgi:hypothetical protein
MPESQMHPLAATTVVTAKPNTKTMLPTKPLSQTIASMATAKQQQAPSQEHRQHHVPFPRVATLPKVTDTLHHFQGCHTYKTEHTNHQQTSFYTPRHAVGVFFYCKLFIFDFF